MLGDTSISTFRVTNTSPMISLTPQASDILLCSNRPLASYPFVGISTSVIDTPILGCPVHSEVLAPLSQGLVNDCHSVGWVEQRMVNVGRKLGFISHGQESHLLCYLAAVKDLESSPLKTSRKDRTAR